MANGWRIEQLHREGKQRRGWEKCQCRKARIQRNHIGCALLVWFRLKAKRDRRSEASNDSKFKIVPEQKPSEVEEQKRVGRPKGIRSNPDYESTTIRLHKQVKAKARYILSTQPEKMDLQTLLNNLLEDFVREQDV